MLVTVRTVRLLPDIDTLCKWVGVKHLKVVLVVLISKSGSFQTSFIPASGNPTGVSRTASHPHSTTSLDQCDTVQPYDHLRRHGKSSTRFISKYFTEFIRANEQVPRILITSKQRLRTLPAARNNLLTLGL